MFNLYYICKAHLIIFIWNLRDKNIYQIIIIIVIIIIIIIIIIIYYHYRLDSVSSQDLNSCLPISTLTSDASNATTTLYHYTRERSEEIVYQYLLIPRDSFHTWETIGSGNDVLYSNIAAPFSSVS